MPTKEPKDSTDLDLAAENARLREQVARLEGRTEGLAQATSTSLDAREGRIFDIWNTSVLDPSFAAKTGAQPLPESSICIMDRGSRSRACLLTVTGSKGRRVVKIDCPSWMNPVNGPWLRRDPVAERHVKLSVLRRYVQEPHLREQVLKMDGGAYKQEDSTHPYEMVAGVYQNVLGRGRPGDHEVRVRLDRAILQCQGLLIPQIQSRAERFVELSPGDALPDWWANPETPENFTPYEVEVPLPANVDPAKDLFDTSTPAKGSPPAAHVGRY